jgi:outer membrane lipoprotein
VAASGSASDSDPAGQVTRTLAGLLFVLALAAALGLSACAPAISQKLRDEAGVAVPFPDLLSRPDTYQGRIVILGGYILETQNEPHGSDLIVLQTPLGFQDKPKARDLSEGRFVITTDKFLDPEVYARDRRITVGGRVAGVRELSLGGTTYRYPVIEAQELHLWPKEVPPPPYYPYDPWYDPWYPWYPWYPWGHRRPWW